MTSVTAWAPPGGAEGVAADGVELDHLGDGAVEDVGRALLLLVRRGDEARPQRLGQDQDVAGPGAGVGQELGRVDQAGHAQAELDLGVAERVAADASPRRPGATRSAAPRRISARIDSGSSSSGKAAMFIAVSGRPFIA